MPTSDDYHLLEDIGSSPIPGELFTCATKLTHSSRPRVVWKYPQGQAEGGRGSEWPYKLGLGFECHEPNLPILDYGSQRDIIRPHEQQRERPTDLYEFNAYPSEVFADFGARTQPSLVFFPQSGTQISSNTTTENTSRRRKCSTCEKLSISIMPALLGKY